MLLPQKALEAVPCLRPRPTAASLTAGQEPPRGAQLEPPSCQHPSPEGAQSPPHGAQVTAAGGVTTALRLVRLRPLDVGPEGKAVAEGGAARPASSLLGFGPEVTWSRDQPFFL